MLFLVVKNCIEQQLSIAEGVKVSVGWMLITAGIMLVLLRRRALNKLQLGRGGVIGGSGKVPAVCSVCSACEGSVPRAFG